jgi:hypothetical protein
MKNSIDLAKFTCRLTRSLNELPTNSDQILLKPKRHYHKSTLLQFQADSL